MEVKKIMTEDEMTAFLLKLGCEVSDINPIDRCLVKEYAEELGYKCFYLGDDERMFTLADKVIEGYWEALEIIRFNTKGKLMSDWYIWKKGTSRSDIWLWFDTVHSRGLGYLFLNNTKIHPRSKQVLIIYDWADQDILATILVDRDVDMGELNEKIGKLLEENPDWEIENLIANFPIGDFVYLPFKTLGI